VKLAISLYAFTSIFFLASFQRTFTATICLRDEIAYFKYDVVSGGSRATMVDTYSHVDRCGGYGGTYGGGKFIFRFVPTTGPCRNLATCSINDVNDI